MRIIEVSQCGPLCPLFHDNGELVDFCKRICDELTVNNIDGFPGNCPLKPPTSENVEDPKNSPPEANKQTHSEICTLSPCDYCVGCKVASECHNYSEFIGRKLRYVS